METKNVYNKQVADELITRINKLNANTPALWGKMDAGQMLAHLNVAYEMAFEDKHKKPGFVTRALLKLFVKGPVTNDKPYKRNTQTAPAFMQKTSKVFDHEKDRLIQYIVKTQEHGSDYFDNKESLSFGPLSAGEWNNLFYKHLNHHLSQFGV